MNAMKGVQVNVRVSVVNGWSKSGGERAAGPARVRAPLGSPPAVATRVARGRAIGQVGSVCVRAVSTSGELNLRSKLSLMVARLVLIAGRPALRS